MAEELVPESVSRRISALRWLACLVPVIGHALQAFFFTDEYPLFAGRVVPNLDAPYRWTYATIFYSVVVGVVPIFFVFSGYLHFARPRPYAVILKRRLPRLLVPMALWTAIFSAIALLLIPIVGLCNGYDFLFSLDPRVWFTRLVGDYSRPFDPGICCPTVYQFWYLRDLVVLILLGPLIGWGLRRAPVVFFVLVCACAFGGWRPLVVGMNSILFYSIGAFCGLKKIDFFALVDRYCPWSLTAAGLVVQIVIMRYCEGRWEDPMVTCFFSVFLFLKVSAALVKNERRYALLHRLDRQSFFIYCAHGGTVCNSVFMLTSLVLPYERPWMTVVGTFLIFAINATCCSALGLALERWCPRVFALLTGGRK